MEYTVSKADIISPCVKPEGMALMYDRVRYLIKTRRTIVARRDHNPFKSLALWAAALRSKNWNVLSNLVDSEEFFFAFQSPWQKSQLSRYGSSMIMLDATHNLVNNYFLSEKKKVNLFTIIVRDAVVGKGVPNA